MERAAQVKRQVFDGTVFEIINFICKKISDWMEPSQPVFIKPSQLGKHASPLLKCQSRWASLFLACIYLGISQKKK